MKFVAFKILLTLFILSMIDAIIFGMIWKLRTDWMYKAGIIGLIAMLLIGGIAIIIGIWSLKQDS
jgi:hypothetical protein